MGQAHLSRRGVIGGAGAAFAALVAGPALAIDLPFANGGTPEAQTRLGRVRGRVDDAIAVFKGIPYGAPTSGQARFMPPQPPRDWDRRDADSFGAQCPQVSTDLPAALRSWDTNLASNEDCLSLNVWTPGLDGRRPVMVWIHDSFTAGNSAAPVYDGVRLCRRGDVVVVSVNHRLNAFGYLYLGGIEPRFADSGNIGQLDLIAALQWVRDNIAGFGGDPGRVTLFGQGDGAAKIAALMAMPAARGLFHRAALQSGPGLRAISAEAATASAREVMRAIGAGGPGFMQLAPFPRILDAVRDVTRAGTGVFGPVIDGRNLTRDPFSPDGAPTSADVPILVGYNASETTGSTSAAGAFDLDWGRLDGALSAAMPGMTPGPLVAEYRRLRPQASAADLYFAITTARGVGADSITLAERKAAQASAGAYLYRLDFETSVERLRSARGLDVPLVFDNVGKASSLLAPVAANAQLVADTMSAAWLAFARTGSPNATGLPSWPRYDPRARSTMVFNTVSRAVNDPGSAERQLIAALPARP